MDTERFNTKEIGLDHVSLTLYIDIPTVLDIYIQTNCELKQDSTHAPQNECKSSLLNEFLTHL